MGCEAQRHASGCKTQWHIIWLFGENDTKPHLLSEQQFCNISLDNKTVTLLWHKTPSQPFAAINGQRATSLPWSHFIQLPSHIKDQGKAKSSMVSNSPIILLLSLNSTIYVISLSPKSGKNYHFFLKLIFDLSDDPSKPSISQ